MINVSIVIVTKNSFRDKTGSVATVIASLAAQQNISFEIIIVDNGSQESDRKKLDQCIVDGPNLVIKVLYVDTVGVASARNCGAQACSGDVIVFMDDDSVLLSTNIVELVHARSQKHQYGYGAIRFWTNRAWYDNHREYLDKDIILGRFIELIKASDEPDPSIRKKSTSKYLNRSFIGNFGFVRRDVLNHVGGWPECFSGYGCEDDAMAFLLFHHFGRPNILSDISVAHISHEIGEISFKDYERNLSVYRQFLSQYGVNKFHIGDLLYESFERSITGKCLGKHVLQS